MQFKLPPGMALPAESTDVHITVAEGDQFTEVMIGNRWRGTDGDRRVVLASASLSYKASRRIVTFEIPGIPEQTWQLDLPSDPDPTPGYSPWRLPGDRGGGKIEMNFSLGADR